jgi:hypothetical protein
MAPKRKARNHISMPPRKLRNRPAKPYVYEPLFPGEIRILVLSPGEENDSLRATLEMEDMADRPQYKAISYTWGDPIFSHSLQLPGGTIQITKSLSDTLKCFRNDTKDVRLWADAVCIDQNCVEERNHQVAIMHQIYEEAEAVLIWLGGIRPSDCLVSFLLGSIAMLPEASPSHPDLPFSEEVMVRHDEVRMSSKARPVWRTCDQCEACFSIQGSRISKNALSEFTSRPWFSRLWVIQEAWCAQDFTMYFGNHHVDRSTIERAFLSMFDAFGVSRDLGLEGDPAQRIFEEGPLLDLLFSSISKSPESGSAHALFELIIATRHAALTAPHDRVFAIRRLANAHNMEDLKPDYSLPIEELHARVAMVELTEPSYWTQQLDVNRPSPMLVLSLAGVQRRWDDVNGVSWVPDINNLNEECFRKWFHHENESRLTWAGGKSSIDVVGNMSLDSFRVSGKITGRIEDVCEFTQYCLQDSRPPETDKSADHKAQFEASVLPWFKGCVNFVLLSQASVASDYQSLTTVMIQGRTLTYQNTSSSKQKRLKVSFHDWLRTNESATKSAVNVQAVYQTFNSIVRNWSLLMKNLDRTRVLASSTAGHIGWVPEAAVPGDQIVLFRGSPLPFILRKRSDGYYAVIGDAYIHGIMHGEAWPGDDDSGVDWIEIK